jgi:hypothetical protein
MFTLASPSYKNCVRRRPLSSLSSGEREAGISLESNIERLRGEHLTVSLESYVERREIGGGSFRQGHPGESSLST